MDSTLQALQQIAQGGGPVLLIAVMWIGYRAMRSAEKAVEAFNGMRTDIAEVKASLVGSVPQREEGMKLIRDIDARAQSIDLTMAENGRKLDRIATKVAA